MYEGSFLVSLKCVCRVETFCMGEAELQSCFSLRKFIRGLICDSELGSSIFRVLLEVKSAKENGLLLGDQISGDIKCPSRLWSTI